MFSNMYTRERFTKTNLSNSQKSSFKKIYVVSGTYLNLLDNVLALDKKNEIQVIYWHLSACSALPSFLQYVCSRPASSS